MTPPLTLTFSLGSLANMRGLIYLASFLWTQKDTPNMKASFLSKLLTRLLSVSPFFPRTILTQWNNLPLSIFNEHCSLVTFKS